MEFIVLAGGLGKRLRSVVLNKPKPMADINGKPFLQILFDWAYKRGATRYIVAVSYLKESIINYFGKEYKGIPIEYSVEDEPLGTGGGIKKAASICKGKDIIVMNGDTYFDVDIKDMLRVHRSNNNDLTVAGRKISDMSRYGTLVLDGNRIIKVEEKKYTDKGVINGGIYILKKDYIGKLPFTGNFSFEKDVLERDALNKRFEACVFKEYFIDIGIPEDYRRAQEELK